MGDNENTVVMAPIEDDELNTSNIKDALLNMTRELEAIKEPNNDLTQDLILEKEKIKQKYLEDEKDNEDEDDEAEVEKTDEAPRISNVDKSFYTNSISFNKTDFEGFDDLEKVRKKWNLSKNRNIFNHYCFRNYNILDIKLNIWMEHNIRSIKTSYFLYNLIW